MQHKRPKVIDLFSGAGGFSSGFEKAGFEVVAAVEYDKQIAETYSFNHPKVDMYAEDIKTVVDKIDFSKYKADIIIGGPPCQGFSMAGARIRKNVFLDDFFDDEGDARDDTRAYLGERLGYDFG